MAWVECLGGVSVWAEDALSAGDRGPVGGECGMVEYISMEHRWQVYKNDAWWTMINVLIRPSHALEVLSRYLLGYGTYT